MDATESVEKEIDKVITKFTDIKNQSNLIINDINCVLEVCKQKLCESYFQSPISRTNELIVIIVLDKQDKESPVSVEQANELKTVLENCRSRLNSIGTDHRQVKKSIAIIIIF